MVTFETLFWAQECDCFQHKKNILSIVAETYLIINNIVAIWVEISLHFLYTIFSLE